MVKLHHYLQLAIQHRASDLHLSAGEKVRLRIDGDLKTLDEAMAVDKMQELFFEVLTAEERSRFLTEKNLDKSYVAAGIGSFRLNLFLNRKGMAAVLRAIPSQVPTLDELGLPEIVTRFSGLSKGLVLVTGPTGSGKSTTLAAMIDWINSTQPSHVLTIEDPIEFIHQSKTALINQREIGHSCLNFADGLKYALREDPDVILIGELRDLETMALALTAAETGHLVLATLHTRGAAASIDRIIDSFAANQQSMIRTMLAESLAGVVSQTLLKRADGKGRVGAYEIMVVNHAISNLIREGKVFQIESVMQTARKEGMVLLPQSVKSLLDRGLVTKEEANPYLIEQTAATAVQAVSIAPAVVPKPEPKPVQPFQELADGILDLTDDSLDLIRQDLDDVEAELEIPKPAIQAPPPVPPPLKKKTR